MDFLCFMLFQLPFCIHVPFDRPHLRRFLPLSNKSFHRAYKLEIYHPTMIRILDQMSLVQGPSNIPVILDILSQFQIDIFPAKVVIEV